MIGALLGKSSPILRLALGRGLPSAALSIALAGVGSCTPARMPRSIGHPLAGEPAPPFQGVTTLENDVGIPARRRTKVTVIDFWASWCGACQESLPALDALYRRHKKDGVMVIGVSVDDTEGDATAAMQRLHASFPVVVDSGQRIASTYGVAQIPITFVVDKAGTVRWVGRGSAEAWRAVEFVLAE